jgi:hypothetical protein
MFLCGILILFFAWLLIHAFIYSKSESQYRIIEGLDPSGELRSPTPSSPATAAAPATAATAPATATATAGEQRQGTTLQAQGAKPPSQTQIDENTAEIAILKGQIASLNDTATQLNANMIQNEAGVKNNTGLIQKVVKSQNDMQTKLANMKSSQ